MGMGIYFGAVRAVILSHKKSNNDLHYQLLPGLKLLYYI